MHEESGKKRLFHILTSFSPKREKKGEHFVFSLLPPLALLNAVTIQYYTKGEVNSPCRGGKNNIAYSSKPHSQAVEFSTRDHLFPLIFFLFFFLHTHTPDAGGTKQEARRSQATETEENKNRLCSMTCGGDEIVLTKLSGKSPYYIAIRDRVTTQSWVLDPTPKRIHRTEVKQKEIGWVVLRIPPRSAFMKPKYRTVDRELSNCSPTTTRTTTLTVLGHDGLAAGEKWENRALLCFQLWLFFKLTCKTGAVRWQKIPL